MNCKKVSENKQHFALVTGASSGIGLAISRELAGYGFSILMVSNMEDELFRAAGEIEKTRDVTATPLFMDLALPDSAEKLHGYCTEHGIKVKILVNNAGIFFFRDICDTPPERITVINNLHVRTPVMLCRLFAEQMILEKRKGYIVNMASIAAQMMMPGITLYNATKSYLRCFSRAMRCEVLDRGVSITTICPGAVATGLYGLAPGYMKLGIRLGIILTPERLARRVIKKMFQRKAEYIPGGIVNRLFILIVNLLPEFLVRWLKRKIDRRIK